MNTILLLISLLAQTFPYPGPGRMPSSTELSWVTSFTPGSIHGAFAGTSGVKLTVGGSPINITKVGRYCISGNSGTHTFHISDNSADLGSVSIDMTGCTGGTFVYASLSVTLSASTTYYLGTQEASDQFLDNDSTVTVTGVATDDSAGYSVDPYTASGWNPFGSAGTMFTGIDFKYTP